LLKNAVARDESSVTYSAEHLLLGRSVRVRLLHGGQTGEEDDEQISTNSQILFRGRAPDGRSYLVLDEGAARRTTAPDSPGWHHRWWHTRKLLLLLLAFALLGLAGWTYYGAVFLPSVEKQNEYNEIARMVAQCDATFRSLSRDDREGAALYRKTVPAFSLLRRTLIRARAAGFDSTPLWSTTWAYAKYADDLEESNVRAGCLSMCIDELCRQDASKRSAANFALKVGHDYLDVLDHGTWNLNLTEHNITMARQVASYYIRAFGIIASSPAGRMSDKTHEALAQTSALVPALKAYAAAHGNSEIDLQAEILRAAATQVQKSELSNF
jgi:hypothetical protein